MSEDVQARHSGIPWKDIVGTHNRLIHEYGDVDYDVVWKIVDEDSPALSRELRTALRKEKGTDQESLWT